MGSLCTITGTTSEQEKIKTGLIPGTLQKISISQRCDTSAKVTLTKKMEDTEGFEPSKPVKACLLSKEVVSAAHPRVHAVWLQIAL